MNALLLLNIYIEYLINPHSNPMRHNISLSLLGGITSFKNIFLVINIF